MKKSLALIFVACLSACGDKSRPSVVIPEELRRPVEVRCASGSTQAHLGRCAIALRQGLNEANSKLASINSIYEKAQE